MIDDEINCKIQLIFVVELSPSVNPTHADFLFQIQIGVHDDNYVWPYSKNS